jgi:hypothetical protein
LLQLRVQKLLASNEWQRAFGLLIFINFVINMVQSQTLPGEETGFGRAFNTLDILFTTVPYYTTTTTSQQQAARQAASTASSSTSSN